MRKQIWIINQNSTLMKKPVSNSKQKKSTFIAWSFDFHSIPWKKKLNYSENIWMNGRLENHTHMDIAEIANSMT